MEKTEPLEVAISSEFTAYPSRRLLFPGWSRAVLAPGPNTPVPTIGYMQLLGWEELAPLQLWRARQWDPNSELDLLLSAVWALCDPETRLPQYIRFSAGSVEEGWDVRNLWLTRESLCGGRFGRPGDSGAPVLVTVDSSREEERRLRLVGMVVGGLGNGSLDSFGRPIEEETRCIVCDEAHNYRHCTAHRAPSEVDSRCLHWEVRKGQ